MRFYSFFSTKPLLCNLIIGKQFTSFALVRPKRRVRFLYAGQYLRGGVSSRTSLFGFLKHRKPFFRPRVIFYPSDYRHTFRFGGSFFGTKSYRTKKTFAFSTFGSAVPKFFRELYKRRRRYRRRKKRFQIRGRLLLKRLVRLKPPTIFSPIVRRSFFKKHPRSVLNQKQRRVGYQFIPPQFSFPPHFRNEGRLFGLLNEPALTASTNTPIKTPLFWNERPIINRYRSMHLTDYVNTVSLRLGYRKANANLSKVWFRRRNQRTRGRHARPYNRVRNKIAKATVRGLNSAFGGPLFGHAVWRSRGAPKYAPIDRMFVNRYNRYGAYIGRASWENRYDLTHVWIFTNFPVYAWFDDAGFMVETYYRRGGHSRYLNFKWRAARLLARDWVAPTGGGNFMNRRFTKLYFSRLLVFLGRSFSILLKQLGRVSVATPLAPLTPQPSISFTLNTLFAGTVFWCFHRLRRFFGTQAVFPLLFSCDVLLRQRRFVRIFMGELPSSAYASLFTVSRSIGGSLGRGVTVRSGLSSFEFLNILRLQFFTWGGYGFNDMPAVVETDNFLFPHNAEKPKSNRYPHVGRVYYPELDFLFDEPDFFMPSEVFENRQSPILDTHALVNGSYLTYPADIRAEREFDQELVWDRFGALKDDRARETFDSVIPNSMSDYWSFTDSVELERDEESSRAEFFRAGLEKWDMIYSMPSLESMDAYFGDWDDFYDLQYADGDLAEISWSLDTINLESRFWGFSYHSLGRQRGNLLNYRVQRFAEISDALFIDIGGNVGGHVLGGVHYDSLVGNVPNLTVSGYFLDDLVTWVHANNLVDVYPPLGSLSTFSLQRFAVLTRLWGSFTQDDSPLCSLLSLQVKPVECVTRFCKQLSYALASELFSTIFLTLPTPTFSMSSEFASFWLSSKSVPYSRLPTLESSFLQYADLGDPDIFDAIVDLYDKEKRWKRIHREDELFRSSTYFSVVDSPVPVDGTVGIFDLSTMLLTPSVSSFFVPQVVLPSSMVAHLPRNRAGFALAQRGGVRVEGVENFMLETKPILGYDSQGFGYQRAYSSFLLDASSVVNGPGSSGSYLLSGVKTTSSFYSGLSSAVGFNLSTLTRFSEEFSRGVTSSADRIISFADLRKLKHQFRFIMYQLPHYRTVKRSLTRYRFVMRRARRYGLGFCGRMFLFFQSMLLLEEADLDDITDDSHAYSSAGGTEVLVGRGMDSLQGGSGGQVSSNYSEFWWWGGLLYSPMKEWAAPSFFVHDQRRYHSHIGHGITNVVHSYAEHPNNFDLSTLGRRMWYRRHFRMKFIRARIYHFIDYGLRYHSFPFRWWWRYPAFVVRKFALNARLFKDPLRQGFGWRSPIPALLNWPISAFIFCFMMIISQANIWWIAWDPHKTLRTPLARQYSNRKLYLGPWGWWFTFPRSRVRHKYMDKRYLRKLRWWGSAFGLLRKWRRRFSIRLSFTSWIPLRNGSWCLNAFWLLRKVLWPRGFAIMLRKLLQRPFVRYIKPIRHVLRRLYLYYIREIRFVPFRLVDLVTILYFVFLGTVRFIWGCVFATARGLYRWLRRRWGGGGSLFAFVGYWRFNLPWYWRWFKKYYFSPLTAWPRIFRRYVPNYLYTRGLHYLYQWGGIYAIWRDKRYLFFKATAMLLWLRVVSYGPARGLRFLALNSASIVRLIVGYVLSLIITPRFWITWLSLLFTMRNLFTKLFTYILQFLASIIIFVLVIFLCLYFLWTLLVYIVFICHFFFL